ncbi:MAG: hypothetical protein PHU51_05600 [Candidatus Nanoarchaeia archaeon]|nr:hypothetical protein [Candidatus Nanoarchaeia archaeon]
MKSLTNALLITYILATGALALAKDSLKYPLVPVADKDTELDKEKTDKVLKLVNYVITKNDQKGLLSHKPDTALDRSYQGVQAVMKIGDTRYTIWVANEDETQKIHLDDVLSIWTRPDGTYGQKYITTFSDNGLDGNCDFGITPAMNEVGRILFNQEFAEGNEHKKKFQKIYDSAIDDLINFYESK